MIKREFYIDKISKGFESTPIVALLGARQVGKTSLMQQYIKEGESLWLNGQNPETAQIFAKFSDIESFLKVKVNEQLAGLLVIDEFQFISGISLMMKLLTDKYPSLKILCSGSSSIDIIQEVDESLAGRIRIIPVYSLSFSEYIKFQDVDLFTAYSKLSARDNISVILPRIKSFLMDYLNYGGLPKSALSIDFEEKEEILNDILQTYLLRDVRQYVRNIDFVGFNKLLRILSAQIGNLLNINELSRTSQLSYRQCEQYIYLLEQMYIIQLVPPFLTNKRKEITRMKKVYFTDLGLRNILYNNFIDMDIRMDAGALFENFVYLELLKAPKRKQIYFYRTKDKSEIDFVVQDSKSRIYLFEVKFKNPTKLSRIKALTEFNKINHVDKLYVVNRSIQGVIDNQEYILPYHLDSIL